VTSCPTLAALSISATDRGRGRGILLSIGGVLCVPEGSVASLLVSDDPLESSDLSVDEGDYIKRMSKIHVCDGSRKSE